ncbi:MAG TPA: amino acid adenylation domain-containing protein, partial [Ramlibacter sp.]
LVAMLNADAASADVQVRYRAGERQVLGWQETAAATDAPLPWRQGGLYLVTGGAGGLGLIFAREIVRHAGSVHLVLTGRSTLDATREAQLAQLRAGGAQVSYRTLDVADAGAVRQLVAELAEGARAGRHPALNGILHSAGVLRDNFVLRKSRAEFDSVLAAKVAGLQNLDAATRGMDLDFFALFASLSGVSGNAGQADYATANAFMDSYAAHRNALVRAGGEGAPRGLTVAIDWPFWQDGGMALPESAQDMMWRSAGLRPLQTAPALAAFYSGLAAQASQLLVLQGDATRLRAGFGDAEPARAAPALPAPLAAAPASAASEEAPAPLPGAAIEASEDALQAGTMGLLKRLAGELLKLPPHRIEDDVPLEQYGIESVAMMKLTADLEQVTGALSRTLFFEHPTIEAVTAHLLQEHRAALAAHLLPPAAAAARVAAPVTATAIVNAAPVVHEPVAHAQPAHAEAAQPAPTIPLALAPRTTPPASTDIAIVGMSGRFPGAPDLDTLWQRLAAGDDCITPVPADRWDADAWYDPERGRLGKSYCKWGGFLTDVDRFDAPFFRITPKEAELLDPQERLFLETVWNLLESSGYLGEALQRLTARSVGVFVGSMSQQYHGFAADALRESLVLLSSPSSIANRVSYFFDFQGPSLAVDTMCSSALVALHMACESLLRGDCRLAIAGGVNLSIHPKKYVALAATGMIASHPGSTSFTDGDGYLPAEGVGAVLLKPLAQALADGDEVLGVVKGTAMNHAGQSSGYRVPSAGAQAGLVAGNFRRSGIDPRSISYVESAANGSALGDAIELAALQAAFRQFTPDVGFCAIGSVKSNIGHAEAASGMSQLFKVLLQMRHGQLAPTLRTDRLNPNLRFEGSPFVLQRQLAPWVRPVHGGQALPRRAAVTSVGLGGTSAHVIVEEFGGAGSQPRPAVEGPHLLPLSARTRAQLQEVVARLAAHVAAHPALPLDALARTLQLAREPHEQRLALVAQDHAELLAALRTLAADGLDAPVAVPLLQGDTSEDNADVRRLSSGRTGPAWIALLLAERDLEKLALAWVKGARIPWAQLHGERLRPLLALPTYPFERRRHWLPELETTPVAQPTGQAFQREPTAPLADEMQRFLRHWIAVAAGIPAEDVRPTRSFLDQGLDSLVTSVLRRDFEAAFGRKLSARDLLEHDTPGALAVFAAESEPAVAGRAPAVVVASSDSPLSSAQQGLWIEQQRQPQSTAYNVPLGLRLRPGMDLRVFRAACAALPLQFPELTAVFRRDGDVLRQVLQPGAPLSFEEEWRDAADDAAALAWLQERSRVPFDLARGPLLRVHVLAARDGGPAHALLLVHHIVFDGTSAVLLTQALARWCEQEQASVVPASTRFADYVQWEQQFLASDSARDQLAWWHEQLAGGLAPLRLPVDFPRQELQRGRGAALQRVLPPALAQRLRERARALQVNLSVLFLGAWCMLLQRYDGGDEVAVTLPTAGRPETRFAQVLGCFVNPVVVRTRIATDAPVADFLRGLQGTLADALDHAEHPFPALLQSLQLGPPASAALAQVLFAFQNFVPRGPDAAASPAFEVLDAVGQEGTHELALEVYETNASFRLRLDCDAQLYRPATVTRMLDHLDNLLEAIAARPDDPVGRQPLLATSEREQLLAAARPVASGVDAGTSLVRLWEAQCRRAPQHPALVCGDRTLPYGELAELSGALATRLRAAGLAAGVPVGVCMERGVEMVVALLAIWQAGAVYVPFGSDQPPARMQHLLADSGVKLVLTQRRLRDAWRAQLPATSAPWLAIDEAVSPNAPELAGLAGSAPSVPLGTAYILYTSGSTGLPKGVLVGQRAISHHCQVVGALQQLTADDRVLLFAAMTFDASLEQLLPALLAGATVLVRPQRLWSVGEFRALVRQHGLTVADLPPSYLHELLLATRDDGDWASLASLRLVVAGGEPLLADTARLWRQSPLRAARLLHAYGPTEATVTCLVHEVDDAPGVLPIGRPLPGASALVLDAHGEPVPEGVAGELWIGGAGLALGYLNQPALTRERFVELAAAGGERLYRTGDRACRRGDGSIVFLGRLDTQVKLRGVRIECGEIESVLHGVPGVKQAAVVVRPVQGSDQLVAFVATTARFTLTPESLRDALALRLPPAMLPARFVFLDTLPLGSAAKIDRQALQDWPLTWTGDKVAATPPATDTERRLARIWCDLLQLPHVGVHDDFFAAGGHSLLAVRLAARIEREFGRDL